MARPIENPDREFSTDPRDGDAESLRELLKRGEVADISDPLLRERVGETIARALTHRLWSRH